MMDLVLKAPATTVMFLEGCTIPILIRNRFPYLVNIAEISGVLHPPGPGLKETVSFEVDLAARILAPDAEVPGHLMIKADLRLPLHTVPFDLQITYQTYQEPQWQPATPVMYNAIGCIIVKPRPTLDRQVFISLKDPENEALARRLQVFLQKVGFTGYLAKDDPQYGTPIWREKLPKAIAGSSAVAVIWTRESHLTPHSLVREIEIAAQMKVPIRLIRERGVPLPDGYDEDLEYAPLTRGAPDSSLATFAEVLCRQVAQ